MLVFNQKYYTMKLSSIHQVEEARKVIDSESVGGRKLWVLESPSPNNIISALDQVGDTLGGWISPHGTWVWNRFNASHGHIAKTIGIEPSKSIAFYIKPEEIVNGEVVDVNFETSEFSGSKSIDRLMTNSLIMGVMQILAKRKDALNNQETDDYADLLGSLGGSDS